MAMADPNLAAVWPPLQAGLSQERNNQYLYANLLIQQSWLGLRSGEYTKAEMREILRYLFGSPLVREYWRATTESRDRILVPFTDEYEWSQIADEVCREHEIALASADEGSRGSERNGGWTTAENRGLSPYPEHRKKATRAGQSPGRNVRPRTYQRLSGDDDDPLVGGPPGVWRKDSVQLVGEIGADDGEAAVG
jgi:hypothetical protein